jgi:hypothetical protein
MLRTVRYFVPLVVLSFTSAQEIQIAHMRTDLDFLTSDALQGRLSMDKGGAAAADYVAREFQKAGLRPVGGDSYLQRFALDGYHSDASASSLSVTINGATEQLHRGKDFQGGFKNDVTVEGSIVFAGYGITAPEYNYDDYAGLDTKGRIVLVFDHEPQENDPKSVFNGQGFTRHSNRRVKSLNAERHGAVALLIADDPLRHHAGTFAPPATTATGNKTRRTAPLQSLTIDPPGIPMLSVSDRIAGKLLATASQTPEKWAKSVDSSLHPQSFALPDTRAELHIVNSERREGESSNAVGLLEGSDPKLKNETIIIDAHYDHLGVANGEVYRGANDNASGSVAVMEIARALAHSPARPKRSLLFIVFGSEEEGLLGSYYYTNHPLRPLETTRAVLNLDMIGRNEEHIPQSRGVITVDADTSNEMQLVGGFYSPNLEKVIRGENSAVGLKIDDKFDHTGALSVLFRCDHFPFLLHDVPAVWFFGGFHPGYHEPSDTVEKLNFPKMEKITRLAMRTAIAVANTAVPPGFSARTR